MGGQTAKQKGYSHDIFTKEKVAKCSSELKHQKGKKAACQRKSTTVEKKERLVQAPEFAIAEGGGVDVDVDE